MTDNNPSRLEEEWKTEFRQAIIDLDDLNHHFTTDKPIKGDIYFDGIEIEGRIGSLLSSQRQAHNKEIIDQLNILLNMPSEQAIIKGIETLVQVYKKEAT